MLQIKLIFKQIKKMSYNVKKIQYFLFFALTLKIQILQTHETPNIDRKLSGPPFIVTLTFNSSLSNKYIFNNYHIKMYPNDVIVYAVKEDDSLSDISSDLIIEESSKLVKYNKTTTYSRFSLQFQKELTTFQEMFYSTNPLSIIFDESFNSLNIQNMCSLFRKCSSLESVDVKYLKTSDVTDMSNMFDGCKLLTTLDLSNFVPKNLKYANGLFNGCKALTSLDLSNFKISNSTNVKSMFSSCGNLRYLNFFNFDTLYLVSSSDFTALKSFQYCQFYSYNDNVKDSKGCKIFLRFSKCSGCENSNIDDCCELTINNAKTNFFYKESELNNDQKECYWFEGVERCAYLQDSDISGFETNLNNILCKKCDNLFDYYPLEEDINNAEFNCYKKEELPNHFLYNESGNKYFKKCDVSCNNCTEEGIKCYECSTNYYRLKEKQEQYNYCYNETTKPKNYYLVESNGKKYYELCDNSCLTCIDESKKCIECNLNYYKLKESKDKDGKCYNETNKLEGYFLKEDGTEKYFEVCDNSCLSCTQEKDNCDQCNENYYKLNIMKLVIILVFNVKMKIKNVINVLKIILD